MSCRNNTTTGHGCFHRKFSHLSQEGFHFTYLCKISWQGHRACTHFGSNLRFIGKFVSGCTLQHLGTDEWCDVWWIWFFRRYVTFLSFVEGKRGFLRECKRFFRHFFKRNNSFSTQFRVTCCWITRGSLGRRPIRLWGCSWIHWKASTKEGSFKSCRRKCVTGRSLAVDFFTGLWWSLLGTMSFVTDYCFSCIIRITSNQEGFVCGFLRYIGLQSHTGNFDSWGCHNNSGGFQSHCWCSWSQEWCLFSQTHRRGNSRTQRHDMFHESIGHCLCTIDTSCCCSGLFHNFCFKSFCCGRQFFCVRRETDTTSWFTVRFFSFEALHLPWACNSSCCNWISSLFGQRLSWNIFCFGRTSTRSLQRFKCFSCFVLFLLSTYPSLYKAALLYSFRNSS